MEKEDLISALPDSLIQHILSFLPTKISIQTGILSKRWENQWTLVPVLNFDNSSSGSGMSPKSFLKLIEYALIFHECSKIKKFHLRYSFGSKKKDPQFAAKIRFATKKHVEDLRLLPSPATQELLPILVFNNPSLVKLETHRCAFMPNGKVNWRCLTTMDLHACDFTDQSMDHILSGSPSLKSLSISSCTGFDKLVIASKSLKTLYSCSLGIKGIEISCPNLEELILKYITVGDAPKLFAQAIEKVISDSPLLESFTLGACRGKLLKFINLVIASKSLKRLTFASLDVFNGVLEISCPKLEELWLLSGLRFETFKLLNLPSSLWANIYPQYLSCGNLNIRMIKDILQSLQHVEKLEIRTSLVMELSNLEFKGDLLLPMLNIKCLNLNSVNHSQHLYGIARLLCNSIVLEELTIRVDPYHETCDYDEKLNAFGKNHWSSNAAIFNCLASHLKCILIIGFPCTDLNRKPMVNFVRFLLENAKVLEKMIVKLNGEPGFMLKVSQELISLPRYSRHAIVKIIYTE